MAPRPFLRVGAGLIQSQKYFRRDCLSLIREFDRQAGGRTREATEFTSFFLLLVVVAIAAMTAIESRRAATFWRGKRVLRIDQFLRRAVIGL
jgi:hypothetical protein